MTKSNQMETTQGTIERLKREINYFERMIDDCINKYGFSKDSFLIEYYRMDIRQREQKIKELEKKK